MSTRALVSLWVFSILAVVVLAVPDAWAVSTVSVHVTGQTGQAVQGAAVTIRRSDDPQRAPVTLTTGEDGRTRPTDLPPGPYTVSVTKDQSRATEQDVTLMEGQAAVLDFSLGESAGGSPVRSAGSSRRGPVEFFAGAFGGWQTNPRLTITKDTVDTTVRSPAGDIVSTKHVDNDTNVSNAQFKPSVSYWTGGVAFGASIPFCETDTMSWTGRPSIGLGGTSLSLDFENLSNGSKVTYKGDLLTVDFRYEGLAEWKNFPSPEAHATGGLVVDFANGFNQSATRSMPIGVPGGLANTQSFSVSYQHLFVGLKAGLEYKTGLPVMPSVYGSIGAGADWTWVDLKGAVNILAGNGATQQTSITNHLDHTTGVATFGLNAEFVHSLGAGISGYTNGSDAGFNVTFNYTFK